MTMKIKIIICLLIPFLVSCSTLSHKTRPSIKREQISLLSVKIIADMPTPIHSEKENYDEGVIYTYIFNDGVVLFFEGALMQFEPDVYTPQKSIRKNGCSIFWGEEHGKIWKKYVYGNVRLYYYNVNPKDKKKYDDILKTIKIEKYE